MRDPVGMSEPARIGSSKTAGRRRCEPLDQTDVALDRARIRLRVRARANRLAQASHLLRARRPLCQRQSGKRPKPRPYRPPDAPLPIGVAGKLADGSILDDVLGNAGIPPVTVRNGTIDLSLPGQTAVILIPRR